MVTIEVQLRDVDDADLATFYDDQLDPVATAMADFPARDRATYWAHWAKIRALPDAIQQAVIVDGELAGYVGSWRAESHREIGYWVSRAHWGRGVATRAVSLLVAQVTERPIFAEVAARNVGSMRVLEKTGFRRVAEDEAPAPVSDDESHPVVVFVLD